MSATITVDRAEFEAILDRLGGLAWFADRVYGNGSFEGVLYVEAYNIRNRLLELAGVSPMDEDAGQDRLAREEVVEQELIQKLIARLRPKAVAS